QTPALLAANRRDLENGRSADLSAALIDRLTLNESRIEAMAAGLEQIAQLPDPVGETIAQWRRPNGLEIGQVRIPIGVVGVIYEARPNVTADAAGLCLKSGNAVVLKSGSEAIASSQAIADVIRAAVGEAGLPDTAVQLIPTTDRQAVNVLLRQDQYIDVIVPRGGPSLIRAITESSAVPVIQHYAGICHTYVDRHADLAMAERICFNAKVQRPGVCNAMETMLVHQAVAGAFLPAMIARLRAATVEIRGCDRTRAVVPDVTLATEEDWRTEYLDLILSVKVVDSLADAIAFITTYGTGHSDAIITDHYDRARQFLRQVDSAAVYVNASTRFTDGYEFGFGAEVGISTNRLHARGPMGLRELTTYKYVVYGNGQIRE
ncbi:MAG TPA: glutamate-5-semialdehyde dehydrogenase, partial [Candidatus Kryptonia bacterium]|nr:glutamate-5-semialdehyde dehydrogenase [Candidatus Kryptonia bacterium]